VLGRNGYSRCKRGPAQPVERAVAQHAAAAAAAKGGAAVAAGGVEEDAHIAVTVQCEYTSAQLKCCTVHST
jgi:hypothetical protein